MNKKQSKKLKYEPLLRIEVKLLIWAIVSFAGLFALFFILRYLVQ